MAGQKKAEPNADTASIKDAQDEQAHQKTATGEKIMVIGAISN